MPGGLSLQERVRAICQSHGIQQDHTDWYVRNLNPDAISNADLFSDERIWNSIISQELFWGLGDAILNYLNWESSQI